MTSTIARPRSTVVAELVCPRCARRSTLARDTAFVDASRTVHRCWLPRCQQLVWVMHFVAGDVAAQLTAAFGATLGAELAQAFALPPSLTRAAYWTVRLSRVDVERCRTAGVPAVLLELARRTAA